MKKWIIKFFDKDDNLLKEESLKTNSTYFVKKTANRIAGKIDGCERFSYNEV